MADDKTISFEEHTKVQQNFQREEEKRQRLEAELVDLKKRFEPFEKVDLTQLRADAEAYHQMRKDTAKTPEEIDKLVTDKEKRIRAEVQKELDELKNKEHTLSSRVKELEIVDRAMSQIGGIFNDDMQDFVKGHVRVCVDKNDAGELIVRDERGELRYSRTDRTKPMTLREFAEEIAEKHPSTAKPTQTKGAMQAGERSNGTSHTVPVERYLRMSAQERATLPVDERRKLAVEAVKASGRLAGVR
jgi:hypothetical protein